jgi:hypothetical protein
MRRPCLILRTNGRQIGPRGGYLVRSALQWRTRNWRRAWEIGASNAVFPTWGQPFRGSPSPVSLAAAEVVRQEVHPGTGQDSRGLSSGAPPLGALTCEYRNANGTGKRAKFLVLLFRIEQTPDANDKAVDQPKLLLGVCAVELTTLCEVRLRRCTQPGEHNHRAVGTVARMVLIRCSGTGRRKDARTAKSVLRNRFTAR